MPGGARRAPIEPRILRLQFGGAEALKRDPRLSSNHMLEPQDKLLILMCLLKTPRVCFQAQWLLALVETAHRAAPR